LAHDELEQDQLNTDRSDKLPPGWSIQPIASVCAINPKKPATDALKPTDPVTFVPMPAVDADAGAITSPLPRAFSQVRKGFTAFANEDVIVAKITPCFENGKAALCRGLTNGLGFGSTEFHVLRSTGVVLPEYVYHFVRQESFRRDGEANMTGSVGQKRVPAEWLKSVEIPFPPLAEQRRIVAKVEAVLARVSAARQRLAKAPSLLKRFRQSVLAAACSGRLTADWRGDGVDDTPDGWKASTLGETYKLERGRFLARPRNDPQFFGGSHPFIQIGCLPPDGGLITKCEQTLNEKGLEVSRKFPKGTVLIAIVGATIGNTGILSFDSCCPDSLVAVKARTEVESKFVEYFLRLKKLDVRETSYASGGQPNINLQTLAPYQILLPPLPEQHEIVRRIEALFALADKIEARITAARTRADKLIQSTLAKAFRGELVPQTPNEQPAAVLLANANNTEESSESVVPVRRVRRIRERL
jgi:type I restriction enzyme S subunit